jgi:GntR family transcriptional regulator
MSNFVNSLSDIPKYRQLGDILRRRIDDKEWKPHEQVPSERELIETYKVSRTTVREALNLLIAEEIIYRRHGKGTFVAYPKVQFRLDRLMSFSQEMELRGLRSGYKLLELSYVKPEQRIYEQLGLPPQQEKVLFIKRLRLTNGEPLSVQDAYLALEPHQTITESDLEGSPSLYKILESKHQILLVTADETIEAAAAGKEEASLLDMSIGSPILLMERRTFSEDGKVIEFVRSMSRGDRYRCYAHKTRLNNAHA